MRKARSRYYKTKNFIRKIKYCRKHFETSFKLIFNLIYTFIKYSENQIVSYRTYFSKYTNIEYRDNYF